MNCHILSIWHIIYHLFFNCFFYSKFFLISFLQFFFINTSNNFFTIKIINKISPWNCFFNFFNYKNFFWTIRNISFCKNIFILRNSNIITNFKFRIFFIWMLIVFSIIIIRNFNRFLFNSSMNSVILFINNII